MTTRWAIRFGYDGAGFAGWARQPGQRTVEGEIRRGAVQRGIAPSAEALRLEVASRTDRSVHARANLLALSSERPGRALLGALNGIAPDLWFTAASAVPETFRVRDVRRRWYRYFEPAGSDPVAKLRRAATWFVGPVDVRSFGRGYPADVPASRCIDVCTVRRTGEWLIVEVRARSFVYGMVRKIVAALRMHARGELTESDLRSAISGATRFTLPMAEPDRLVLWEVDAGIRWTVIAAPPTRSPAERLAGPRVAAAARAVILEGLADGRGLATGPRSVRRRLG